MTDSRAAAERSSAWAAMARSRPFRGGAAAVVLVLGAVGWLPLFDGPGYEIALAAGLLCPAAAAMVVALERLQRPLQPAATFRHAVAVGLVLAALAYLTTLLHGLRAGFCDAAGGTALFVLGPAVGTVWGALWGALAVELARRIRGGRRRVTAAVLLGLSGPLASAALQLFLFHATPMVFAYDPFVGYFSGALYDTVLEPSGLASYRAASLATLAAVYVASRFLRRVPEGEAGEGRLRVHNPARPGLLLFGALCASASLTSVALGDRLGHWQSAASIAERLGGRLVGTRCVVVFDRSVGQDEAALLARDCDGHLAALERWLGLDEVPTVTVFLFADPLQKRRLMGAAGTSIAKPWRREIYLHRAGYPHRSLGHELAHVAAGPLGRGPFSVAGDWGGLLPNPGLIEGLAVAASPPDDDLSPSEWAKAMRDIGVLPRLDELFALRFFGRHSATAYLAAGSFVAHVRERHGAAVLRKWYGGVPLGELSGQSSAELEQGWHAALDAIALSEAALAQGRARFDRPGVFGRRCPHAVDAELAQAAHERARGDCQGALETYGAALALDPHSASAKLGSAACWDRLGSAERARKSLLEIAHDESAAKAGRARALEQLGDLALRAGQIKAARSFYTQLRREIVDRDRLRTLDVKELGAADPHARPAVLALLVGTDKTGPSRTEALDLLGTWRAAAPDDGLPDYLFARQYLGERRYALAAERLDQALEKRLELPSVRTEAWRLRLLTACALGDAEAAAASLAHYAQRPDVSKARRRTAQALAARCASTPSER